MSNEILKKLFKLRQEITNPAQNATASVGSYSYQYADLPGIIEHAQAWLNKHGLALIQPVMDDKLLTILFDEAGNEFTSSLPIMKDLTPQEFGSWLTYHRRYMICSILGIAAEKDDDGAKIQNRPTQSRPQPQPVRAQTSTPIKPQQQAFNGQSDMPPGW